FSMRERIVIVLGVAVIVFSIVSIYTGPFAIIFSCLTTLGVLGIMLFQQFRELRSAATTLHESEERFRLLINEVQDYAIFGLDPDGIVTSWNQGAERIAGYVGEEIVGRHFSALRASAENAKDACAKMFEQAR